MTQSSTAVIPRARVTAHSECSPCTRSLSPTPPPTCAGLEEQRRFNAWAENDAFIQRHNAEYSQGIHGHWVGHNEVSDLTTAEFTAKYLGTFETSPFATMDKKYKDHTAETAAAPTSIDWVAKGAVTPVKNQAQCGSCWAFSTTGSLEGAHFLELGKLVSFSEQELVSCSSSAGNHGCQGGIMDNAFNWINQNGIVHEDTYPYTSGGGNTGTCDQSKVAQATTFLKSHVDVPNEQQLLGGVAGRPVSIAVQANQPAFQMYSGGIVKSGCGNQLDHGVLIVGYGTDGGVDYWKVKNSWGPTWGDQGYLRIIRNKGMCGIGQVSCYPTGITDQKPKPGPAPTPTPPSPGPAPGPAAKSHYEDPNAGPCQAGEVAVQIQGVKGGFCSPACGFLKPCTKDIPAGTTAQPKCALETQGAKRPTRCALLCQSGSKCPAKASCKMVQGAVGLCTYDS